MDRFTKIVLEQTRKSKPGQVGTTVATDSMNQKGKELKGMPFLLYYVYGKNLSPISKQQVAGVIPKMSTYGDASIFSRGEYFYIIDDGYKDKEGTKRAVIYYPIYIIRKTESNPESLSKFRIGGTDKAPILDIKDFQKIQRARKLDLEYEKAKKDQAITQAIQTNKNPELKTKLTIDPTDSVVMELLIKNNTLPHIYNIFKYDDKMSDFQAIKQRKYVSYKKTAAEQKKFVEDQVNYDKYIRMIKNIRGNEAADKIVRQMLKKHYNQVTENYFKNIGLDKSLKDIIKEIIN